MAVVAPAGLRRKIKLFCFASAPTAVLLVLIELALRAVGYPYVPESLLAPVLVVDETGVLQTNPFFTDVAEAYAVGQGFEIQKPTGTLRIALLGGSSVVNLGQCRLIYQRLVNANLARDVQILNLAVCGCGSDRALVSMREAIQRQADAVVLYSGHNEFISESNRRTYRSPGWLLAHCRLAQWIYQSCGGLAWRREPGRFYTEAEKEAVYAAFRQNLREMAQLAKQHHVVLIWATVAANLRMPPAVYVEDVYEGVPVPQEPLLQHRRGLQLLAAGRYAEARRQLEQAVAASPRPWRATWRTNQIIRQTAKEMAVALVDVERAIRQAAPHGIPGRELFDDHCHLNMRGNRLLQQLLAEAIVQQLRRRGPKH